MPQKKRATRKVHFLPGSFLLLGGAVMLLFLLDYWLSGAILNTIIPGSSRAEAAQLRREVERVLERNGLSPLWMQRNGRNLTVRMPATIHPLQVYHALSNAISEHGGVLTKGESESATGVMKLAYAVNHRLVEVIRLIPDPDLRRASGKIGLIIDDFGYVKNDIVREIMALEVPVTYAIIPGLTYSKEIARELQARGKTVIVHMPMEPRQGRVEAGGFTLLTSQSEDEIRKRMQAALEAIPAAVGVNNHMGSLATTDSLLLTAALTQLRENGCFFVDSRTSNESIAYAMAQRLGVPALRNNLFIDAIDDTAAIEAKFKLLAAIAKRRGSAIGIGHPRPKTLAMLRKMLPELQALGYTFVPVTALLGHAVTLKGE